ncbi:MAG: ATP-binding protein [Nautiliaceae bacterium]
MEFTLRLINAQFKAHNIEIEIIGDDFEVYGNKNQFQQVILNLLSNSKDAIIERKEEGKIKIYIDSDSKEIAVEDNGGGIKEEILDKVFEPYFTTKDEGEGTGIGLYMSKIIIEKYFNASLDIKNTQNGVVSYIRFNKKG